MDRELIFTKIDEKLEKFQHQHEDGIGIYVYPISDGHRNIFFGEFKDNKRNGEGISIYRNNKGYEVGNWKNGLRSQGFFKYNKKPKFIFSLKF